MNRLSPSYQESPQILVALSTICSKKTSTSFSFIKRRYAGCGTSFVKAVYIPFSATIEFILIGAVASASILFLRMVVCTNCWKPWYDSKHKMGWD